MAATETSARRDRTEVGGMAPPHRHGLRARRSRRAWLVWLWGVLALVYTPVAVVMLLSFNESRYGTFPFAFTFDWYVTLVGNERLIAAAVRSLVLSLSVAVVAAVLGTALALWMVRYARVGSVVFGGLLAVVITIPWLILAIAMLLVAVAVGVGRGLPLLFVGSLAVALPYVVLIVLARLHGLGGALEDAARSLGARPLTAFRLVTLPMLARSIGSGSLLAFVITFNNFPLHFFLAPFGFNTLPVEIYTLVLTGYRPDVNALATILMTSAILIGVGLLAVSRQRRGGEGTPQTMRELWGSEA